MKFIHFGTFLHRRLATSPQSVATHCWCWRGVGGWHIANGQIPLHRFDLRRKISASQINTLIPFDLNAFAYHFECARRWSMVVRFHLLLCMDGRDLRQGFRFVRALLVVSSRRRLWVVAETTFAYFNKIKRKLRLCERTSHGIYAHDDEYESHRIWNVSFCRH